MSATAAPEAAIVIAPIYPRRPSDPAQPWRARADWVVSQRIDHPDADAANGLALADLEGGADGLVIVGAASPAARGFGLAAPDRLATALGNIELDLVGVRLDAGADAPAFARAIAELVEARRLGSAALDLDFGFDPIALIASGQPQRPDFTAALVRLAAEAGLGGRPLLADGRPWHEAGASEPRELALVLGGAVAQMRQLEAAGLSPDTARRAIAVLLPFDADVLLGLAKARAVRRLWARLEAACGLDPRPLKLHAETSWRMMTRYDAHTNAMRATAAAFAAGLGGVDTVTVLPMTLVQGLPDAAARRLARNTGRVLLDEAGLGAMDDPAAGSGALEALTDDLCAGAWALFQEVERAGGIEAGLREGRVQAALAGSAERRRADVESLARGIVGTSRFPYLEAPQAKVLDVPRQREAVDHETLSFRRDAEPFEVLRDQAEAHAGGRPRIILATLGEPAAFGARATMAANLFAAVGIAIDPPPAAPCDLATIVMSFQQSGARAACICGDDGAYSGEGEACVRALRGAGAASVLAFDGAIEGADPLPPSGEIMFRTLRDLLRTLIA